MPLVPLYCPQSLQEFRAAVVSEDRVRQEGLGFCAGLCHSGPELGVCA